MKWNCPKCDTVIEASYLSTEKMQEIFKHEKTHKKEVDNDT